MSEMKFDWVSEENKPYSKRDKAVRYLIRKRATQAAAKTKKEARHEGDSSISSPGHSIQSKVLRGKRPEALQREDALRTAPTQVSISQVPQTERRSVESEPRWPALYRSPAPPLQPYHVPSLLPSPEVQALLTGSLLSRFVLKIEHVRISKILSLTSADFMSMVPTQYGHNSCLDAAIDCLSSRVQEFLASSRSRRGSSAYLYGRALQHLQLALDTSDVRKQRDLLLAISLLCLYELFDYDNQLSWLLHAQGAAVLIKHIGPRDVTSELHKTLLITQAPFIIHEALFKAQSCFLGDAEWGAAIASTVDLVARDYDARSNIMVSMVLMTRRLPDLFLRVEHVIFRSVIEDKSSLTLTIEELHNKLNDFQTTWAHDLATKHLYNFSDQRRICLLATTHAYSALASRLLFALTPYRNQFVESLALRSATLAYEIANHAATNTPNVYARMAFPTIIASSIIGSSLEWQACAKSTMSGDVIDAAVLRAWCRVLGRA